MLKFDYPKNVQQFDMVTIPDMKHYIDCSMEEMFAIQQVANEIQEKANVLLVIGVGVPSLELEQLLMHYHLTSEQNPMLRSFMQEIT